MKILFLILLVNICQAAEHGHSIVQLSPQETWIETIRVPEKMSQEAIFFAPIGGTFAYLMSSGGKLLRKWKFPSHVYDVKLDNEGNILALYRDEKLNFRQATGAVRLISKNGKVLWDYKNPNLHHSVSPTNHKTAMLIAHQLVDDPRFKSDIFLKNKNLSCDIILEVDRENNIVWSVDLYKLVKIDDINKMKDRLSWFPSADNQSICHTNSVREYDKTPFSDEPAVLVSIKNLDLVMLIDKKSKKILWQNKSGSSSNQHDARLIGNWVYIFNNGPNNSEINSQAIRLNILNDKREILFEKNSFMHMPWGSPTKSGVIPMNNGNFLIVLGDPGQIWEVTPDGLLVRKIIVLASRLEYEMASTLFTVEKYDQRFLKSVGIVK
ncbi:MAG: aryl-sulfate sulfotransferase [Rhizobacter sp.]|nr:aryl-sulfate sulfotransferase [Bacteriovorax sp.]